MRSGKSPLLFALAIALIAFGAFGGYAQAAQNEQVVFAGNTGRPKQIFVFLDGTSNVAADRTNVRRTFELVRDKGDAQKVALYLPGVGTDDAKLTGNALGRGMESRVIDGLEFICNQSRPNDSVYIFGFSRGAHEARALAGILAYSGVPASGCPRSTLNKLIEQTKKVRELDNEAVQTYWKSRWSANSPPPLAELRGKAIDIDLRAVPVTFLGIWDTVPGSSLKKFPFCSENIGIVKKNLGWLLPGIDHGERYKTRSYPTIGRIAHALSSDEKRSKFHPLHACSPFEGRLTPVVKEVWFPGAHSDVGGGYSDMATVDEGALPQLSLNWMLTELMNTYAGFQTSPLGDSDDSPRGLAHWSISSAGGNLGSHCEDRNMTVAGEPHASVKARIDSGPVRLRVKDRCVTLPYPISCAAINSDKGWDGLMFAGQATKECELPIAGR